MKNQKIGDLKYWQIWLMMVLTNWGQASVKLKKKYIEQLDEVGLKYIHPIRSVNFKEASIGLKGRGQKDKDKNK